uniref:Ash family protein n=1 Tax=Ascaris lumbricoides TaxID=6252 RepID=A0A0M3HI58_ASCLU
MPASIYFGNNSARSFSQCGAISDGFNSTQFPAANAPHSGLSNNCSGKFHGAIMSTTPRGSFCIYAAS